MGKVYMIEGYDGSGKSSIAKNIAKKLNIKPEDIINQNDMETSEILEGQRLTVYVPLDINF